MPDVTLGSQNTLNLTPADGVFYLRPLGLIGAVRAVNVMNLGPGIVWIRTGADPAVNDPLSEKLPANTADNGVVFQSFLGLIAETDTTVVARMVAMG